MATQQFKYKMSLDRELTEEKYIKSVTFNISRYSAHESTITFEELVNENEAISAVEEFLSLVVTEVYFNIVKDDLFLDAEYYLERDLSNFIRGNLLTDCIFLERIIIDDGNIFLSCGS